MPSNCTNDMKLCNLLSAWNNPAQTYNQRAAAVDAIRAGHVFDDAGAPDDLNGSSGQNLFYISAGDSVHGKKKGQIVVTV